MWSSQVGADVLEAHGAGAVGGVVGWRGVWGLGDGHVVYAGHHGGDVFNAVVGPGWCCQIYGGSWVRGAVCSFRWRSHGALENEHKKSKVHPTEARTKVQAVSPRRGWLKVQERCDYTDFFSPRTFLICFFLSVGCQFR